MEYKVRKLPLPDVLKFIVDNRGKTVPTDNKGKIILIATNCIRNDSLFPKYEKVRYLNDETYNNWFRAHPKPGDIIFVNKGTPGRVCLVPDPVDFCIAQDMMAFRVNDDIIYNKYLLAFLRSREIQNQIQVSQVGTTIPHFKKQQLKEILVPILDYKEQKKIGDLYYKISYKIELNNQINDNLQELINSLYIKYFERYDYYKGNYKESDLGNIPSDFNVDTLGNIVTFYNGYGWNSKDMIDTCVDNTYKVFKMGNINIGGGINKSKTKSWILKEKINGLEQYLSKKGDILMCMTDMKNSGNPLLGHTALIDRDDEFVINQRVGILRCDKGIGYSYIYTMSNMPKFINDIRSRANSGVQVNLTTKGICDTIVLVPDKNTLAEFEGVAKPLYEQIFNNNNENESLQQLRDTLLPKLMTGEINLDKIEI